LAVDGTLWQSLIRHAEPRQDSKKILASNAILSLAKDSTLAVIDTRDNTIVDSITTGLFSDTVATQPNLGSD
jgi:hypothetical protein